MTVLGIDPGLATIGYGVLKSEKGVFTVIDYGVLTTPKENTLPQRLALIEEGIAALIKKFSPDCIAVEELFFSKNVTTGIAVSEARGVILLTAHRLVGEKVYEYTPNQIKQAVSGYGGADKRQMQLMIQTLLRLKTPPRPDDAADALSTALCHAQTSRLNSFMIR